MLIKLKSGATIAAGKAGMNANEVKQKLAAMGYTSTKQIKQKDYNAVCDALKGEQKE